MQQPQQDFIAQTQILNTKSARLRAASAFGVDFDLEPRAGGLWPTNVTGCAYGSPLG
ncbi:hypothetical protein SYN65AY6A5_08560 [Synechococcus sp. 65AY6A5]|jgi:hypothetical protein|nr:hypothetical protein CYA_0517 [Synechococcus sp. JA-3-3Ab]PIK89781.1 hypothetical protein SYN65AY6A5_08560 [Synechococcus sp. 65AY6A5]PIK99012.1 hypothetical protein SYN63AY4M1_02760 [Synechococcus sp. 63AY4M1]